MLAAASLSEPFQEIGRAFSEANPGTDVTFVFDASSAHATQIEQGAPADVFASADTATMDRVVAAGLGAAPPELLATNRLAIIVAPGNPESVGGLEDLARPELKVVLCADEVPCGRYARQVLETAAVEVRPVSLEQNVKSVVTRVTAGEGLGGVAAGRHCGPGQHNLDSRQRQVLQPPHARALRGDGHHQPVRHLFS